MIETKHSISSIHCLSVLDVFAEVGKHKCVTPGTYDWEANVYDIFHKHSPTTGHKFYSLVIQQQYTGLTISAIGMPWPMYKVIANNKGPVGWLHIMKSKI